MKVNMIVYFRKKVNIRVYFLKYKIKFHQNYFIAHYYINSHE